MYHSTHKESNYCTEIWKLNFKLLKPIKSPSSSPLMGEDKVGDENLNLSPSLSPSHQGREDMGKSWDYERVIEVRTSFDKSGIISVSKFL